MTDYEYEIDAYYMKSGATKAVFFHGNTDNYPDAMNCYKKFKDTVFGEIEKGSVKVWFLNLSRIHMMGNDRRHVDIKHDGIL